MTTKAHEVTWYIADEWESYYASAVLSGIVGDASHQKTGGYHISIEDNSSSNYSVTRPDDKAPPGTWPRNLAAAIDMSMSPSDMKLCSDRLWAVWYNRASDPRAQYLNGFNGWFNDGGPAKRYDFVSGQISEASSDHKWHVHKEERRKWVTDMTAAKAICSVLRGESKDQYLASLSGGDEMYAKYGDGNNGQPRSRNVKTMQNKLLLLDPGALPQFGPDGGYGDETVSAFVRLVPGVGDGKNYDEVTIPLMDKAFAAKFGGGGQQGPKGDKGDKGDPGEPGKTPTEVTFGPVTATVTSAS